MTERGTYDLLRELGSGGYNRHYLPHEIKQIEDLSLVVLGRPVKVCDCKNRHHDAVLEMLRVVKRKMTMASDYILKAGVVIVEDNNPYTNANLTNEVAEAFLKRKPGATGLFIHIPKKVAPKKVATPKKGNKKSK